MFRAGCRSIFGKGTRGLALATALTVATTGCKVAEAKVHNLDQLHDAESHHRYTAALESDLEFVLRHKVLGLLRGTSASFAEKSPSAVEAPADECLENLIGLEAADSHDPVIAGRQIEWFARLAVEDPWSLSRERAITALAAAGQRLNVGLPAGLGADQKPADAEAVANTLTPLVKALRGVLEGNGTRADLEHACDAVRALDLDLAGARRALRIVVELQAAAGSRNQDTEPITKLGLDLQRTCIKRSLSKTIDDPNPRVRGAALASTARVGGRVAIDTVLFDRLRRETESEVTIQIVDTLAEAGPLPREAPAGARTRDEWLAALYGLIENRRESDVRVHAMLALSQLSDAGLTSLREEDWQAWWLARTPAVAPFGSGAGH